MPVLQGVTLAAGQGLSPQPALATSEPSSLARGRGKPRQASDELQGLQGAIALPRATQSLPARVARQTEVAERDPADLLQAPEHRTRLAATTEEQKRTESHQWQVYRQSDRRLQIIADQGSRAGK